MPRVEPIFQILHLAGTNDLAYSSVTMWPNKLERLSLLSLVERNFQILDLAGTNDLAYSSVTKYPNKLECLSLVSLE